MATASHALKSAPCDFQLHNLRLFATLEAPDLTTCKEHPMTRVFISRLIKPIAVATTLMAPLPLLAGDTPDPLFEALVGKTFVGQSDFSITLEPDGTLSGGNEAIPIAGTWAVEDGQYCRTLVAPTPAAMQGSGCPAVEINGDHVTFTSESGRVRTYTMQ